MLTSHEQRALEFRALAATARASEAASPLAQVQERHAAAAARWDALAEFEDLYVRNAEARRQALEPDAEAVPAGQPA